MPKLSICLAACNQFRLLGDTVRSAMKSLGNADYEIVVIDDCSDDGCCEEVEGLRRVKIYRSEINLGASTAKNEAMARATGDVLISCDTHNIFPRGGLTRLAHFAQAHGGIWQGKIYIPNHRGTKGIVRAGYGLRICKKGIATHLGEKRKKGPPIRSPVICSGPFAMRRDVWQSLGGLVCMPGRWGRFEVATGLSAHRQGIPVRRDLKYTFHHLGYGESGKKRFPYILPPDDPVKNAFYCHAAALPDTFFGYWYPLLMKHYETEPDWHDDKLYPQQRHIRNNAVRTEDETLTSFFGDWRSKVQRLMERDG